MSEKKEVKSNIALKEEEILSFWKKEDIFQKSLDKPNPYGEYVFYDGPPFATGLPHYGSILPSAIKDAIPRYQTMRGKKVLRRWGWDCHGLPIENIIEKELNISGKKEIEKMGIDKFNAKARDSVLKFASEWKHTIDRVGRWVDFDNAYMTMDDDYIESVWWALKEIHKKGLLYEGTKVLTYCSRCETPIANAEIAMDNSYKDIKDISVYVKFKVKGEDNTYFLAWTTTPWTLPGNTALAVDPTKEYVTVDMSKYSTTAVGKYIFAKELTEQIAEVIPGKLENAEIKPEKTVKGKALIGLSYEPLFDYYASGDLENKENGWKVYAGDFITMTEGTGIVHTAPCFGEDDKALADKNQLPTIKHVSLNGGFADEFGDSKVSFKGIPVKAKEHHEKSDVQILKYLAPRGLIFAKQKITHAYPHCHRCDTPLYYFAVPSWFINIQKIKKKLLKYNENIAWYPAHLKHGRFGKTVEAAPDWTISRNRYWATPLPIWKCESCAMVEVIGSRDELFKRAPTWKEKLTDLHRPYIDEVTFACTSCKSRMKRIPEVVDGWVESGAMPFAANHYPFENKKFFKENFPAEFITEYIAQTRTWFYYTHALSTILFQKHAFENVLTTGTILAEDGTKMSKSKDNFSNPKLILNTYGADALRLYLLGSPVMNGEDLNFSEMGVQEMFKKIILTCENSIDFYSLYKGDYRPEGSLLFDVEHPLDRWLVAYHDKMVTEVTNAMDTYDIARAIKVLEEFIREFSQWYIRRSRERFKGDDVLDKEQAISVFGEVLLSIAKCLAPLAPYLAERMYKELYESQGPYESIHLDEWVKPLKSGEYDYELPAMEQGRKVVEVALSIRSDTDIKVRQPLSEMQASVDGKLWNPTGALAGIILSEVNVQKRGTYDSLDDFDGKKVIKKSSGNITVALNTEITEELRRQGTVRDVIRLGNLYRKERNFTIHNDTDVQMHSDSDYINSVIEENKIPIGNKILGTLKLVDSPDAKSYKIGDNTIKIKMTKK